MSISKPSDHSSPPSGGRERLYQVSGTDLANLALRHLQLRGAHLPKEPVFFDSWAAAHFDGVLYGDFTTDVDLPEEARLLSLRVLIGDVIGAPNRECLQRSLQAARETEPQTLLVVMWGQDGSDDAFVSLFYHPRFTEVEAVRWLITLLGCGPLRTGLES